MIAIRVLFFFLLMVVSSAWAQGPDYDVGVDGLACPFCAYGIEKQFHKLDGVQKVETDIENGRVIISMQDGKTLDKIQAEKAVKKAGFSLRSFVQNDEK